MSWANFLSWLAAFWWLWLIGAAVSFSFLLIFTCCLVVHEPCERDEPVPEWWLKLLRFDYHLIYLFFWLGVFSLLLAPVRHLFDRSPMFGNLALALSWLAVTPLFYPGLFVARRKKTPAGDPAKVGDPS